MTTLDEANAAPPASDAERKTALGWTALVMVVGAIAVVLSVGLMWKNHQAHKAEVAAIQSAPVVLPPEPPIYKRIFKPKPATKEVAAEATIKPPSAAFWSIKKVEKPDELEQEKPIAENENMAHKSDEILTLPLPPIPPIPPQRSIP